MSTVTTKDDTRIFYKDWDLKPRSRSCSIMAGHSVPTTGTPKCCSSSGRAIASSPTTARQRAVSQASEGHDMDHYATDAAEVVEQP